MLRNHLLAPLASLGVGGPADWFADVRTEAALLDALAFARREDLPVTVLGGGSNVLISDRGVRGLVVRFARGSAREVGPGRIRASAGMTLNGLIRWTIQRGLGGLEAWAGTPGTVGGAVVGNAHFGGREISETLLSVRRAEAGAVLSADFRVRPGDPADLRARARESLAFRKRTQPLQVPSVGCAFRNPAFVPDGLPAGAGALLDRAGMKGRSVGGVRVSEVHANFLVAGPGARAADYRELLGRCRDAVEARFDVRLEPEIVEIGDVSR